METNQLEPTNKKINQEKLNEELSKFNAQTLEKKIDQQETALIGKMIETVNRANECSVLMSVLCEKLGLKPSETTHQSFVESFSQLQNASLEAQKELQQKFIATPIPQKMRKTRQLKNV